MRAGIAAVIGVENAAELILRLLYFLIHRGNEFAGIVSAEKNDKVNTLHQLHHLGSVDGMCVDGRCLDEDDNEWKLLLDKLPGTSAIGSTGDFSQTVANPFNKMEPYVVNTRFGKMTLALNGDFAGVDPQKQEFIRNSARAIVGHDLEFLAYLIAKSEAAKLEDALTETLSQIELAYSLIIMTPDQLIAVRDRFGVWPLSLGSIGKGKIICSENSFDQLFGHLGCTFIRDIRPGEMLIFDLAANTFTSRQYAEPAEAICAHELIFYGDPRSTVNGFYLEDLRQLLGKKLFDEHPELLADFVMPNPDRGEHPAIGISKAQSRMLFKKYILRRHTFQPMPNPLSKLDAEELATHLSRKLHIRTEKIAHRKALLVDAIMRSGTTIQIINRRLWKAKANELNVGIASPTITDICHIGMGSTDYSRLEAVNLGVEGLRRKTRSSKLAFLSRNGLEQVISETAKCGICTGCFGGNYPGGNYPNRRQQLKFF